MAGRPNYYLIIIVKILLLQQWYDLSDLKIGREVSDRISFLNVRRYPEKLPNRDTIWYFCERIYRTGKDRLVFNDTRNQIMAKRIIIRKGTMQGTSFIETYKGEYGKPPGSEANTRRSKDGSSATDNNEKQFRYREHIPVNGIKIIEKLSVTSASVHDSQMNLSTPGIIC
ncbi:MAG: transposase [Thermoplasmatales archaeon]